MEKLREFDESHIATRAEERTIACVETLHPQRLGHGNAQPHRQTTPPLAYIVNFAEGGYAVVGADSRQGGVVARVEKGSMDAATLAAAKQSIDKAEAEADIDLATYVNSKVALQLQAIERAPEADRSIRSGGAPQHTVDADRNQQHKIENGWDQWSPFNQYYYQQTGNNYPVGCVALALAQVMIYNKHKHDVGINSFNANTTPLLPNLITRSGNS